MEDQSHRTKSHTDASARFGRMRMTPEITGPCSPAAYTLWEVAVVIIVIFCTLSLVVPHFGGAREAPRRMQCVNQLKQIGLAVLTYEQANKAFPPGTIGTSDPVQPANQCDVWAEAGHEESGYHGTSFLLRILPYIEMDNVYKTWDFTHGVGCNAENGKKPAVTEIRAFYCPTRRSSFRPGLDNVMMLDPSWSGGGTNYGGCAGRHAAFTLNTGYNLCDATMHYQPNFQPKGKKGDAFDDTPGKRWGVFGRVNVSTRLGEIADGTSRTIMTGELQRLTDITPGSKDGWAVGGPATLFTTGALAASDGQGSVTIVSTPSGTPLNNKFFGSPGSEHSGTANFGLADGSVRTIRTTIDPNVFALLGSMADANSVELP